MKTLVYAYLFTTLLTLAACGQKGPLQRPDPESTPFSTLPTA